MKAVPRIVAIGGGDLRKLETLRIDRRIVALTGKRRPRALLLPTASGDGEEYFGKFAEVYGAKLGCRTSCLKVLRHAPPRREIADAVLGSDLIYVGGGNTLRMMKAWRRVGLDAMLRKAAARGIVLSGVSAGAICWFAYGHSDSRAFSGKSDWDYIRVRGLGLVDAAFCPHYHAEGREESLSQMVARRGGVAVACDNGSAIEIVGDSYRILTSSQGAKATVVWRRGGDVLREELRAGAGPRSLRRLLDTRR